ncbi:P-loop containing nucleoside triphosphate hydrolase protein [Ochromonadaceae sp. CCMP2298]|nr:P-loop containing nucleoside triphosphate hydrolase protein [Ochromonadaceae sp. CCMP2298]
MPVLELAEELEVTPELALSIVRCAEASSGVGEGREGGGREGGGREGGGREGGGRDGGREVLTAKDIYARHRPRPLITFCQAIDKMLGGGIQTGQITELCGVPGIGKTQMGIQLALNCQIPEAFAGLGGECVYIDTEGSFMVERVAEMAGEIAAHLTKLVSKTVAQKAKSQDSIVAQLTAAQGMTVDRFLEGIQVFRAHDQTETLATINHLSAFLRLHTRVKLVIVDSIAFHFRQEGDAIARARQLSGVAQVLNKAAFEHQVAVVVVNHVTTRFERGYGGGVQRLVPALGEQWSHLVTNRLMLHWTATGVGMGGIGAGRSVRTASLVKSPSMPFHSAQYVITEKGIRDLPQVRCALCVIRCTLSNLRFHPPFF